jgi:hypothetical protein
MPTNLVRIDRKTHSSNTANQVIAPDQVLLPDRSTAASDVASAFSMSGDPPGKMTIKHEPGSSSTAMSGKVERYVDVPCPDEPVGLWTQWMQECLVTFEAGAQWWGNAGPDRHLLATLDHLANSKRWDQNKESTEPAEGVASADYMLPPAPANANVSQVSGSRFSGELRVA